MVNSMENIDYLENPHEMLREFVFDTDKKDKNKAKKLLIENYPNLKIMAINKIKKMIPLIIKRQQNFSNINNMVSYIVKPNFALKFHFETKDEDKREMNIVFQDFLGFDNGGRYFFNIFNQFLNPYENIENFIFEKQNNDFYKEIKKDLNLDPKTLKHYYNKELNFRAKAQAIYKILNKNIIELGYDENTEITDEILNEINDYLQQKEVNF
jgi:hypothetical protein